MRGEFVDLGGARLYCYAFGSRGAGNPIVLIHGAFTTSHLWQDLLPRLPKGRRVLVLDLLGHGRSDPPRVLRMTVAAHASRLIALLDVMGVRNATLIGHGMGAAIATCVARLRTDQVEDLALVNPSLLARDPRDARVNARLRRLAPLVPLWSRLSPSWLASTLHSALLPAFAQRRSGVFALDLYLKGFRSKHGRDTACAQLRAFAQSTADTSAALEPHALHCPVALVLGAADPFMPQGRATRLLAALQQATDDRTTLHCIEGAAHMAPEEAPDRLGTVIGAMLAMQTAREPVPGHSLHDRQ